MRRGRPVARLDIMSLEDGHILNFRAALGRPDGGVNCVLVDGPAEHWLKFR